MRYIRNKEGFSLLELLIVIMIVNILAAATFTIYVGVREKARRGGMSKIAASSQAELQHWLQSSVSQNSNVREIDTNFDGGVDAADATNGALLNNITALYVTGRNTIIGERSPWFNVPLWNTADPPIPGTISLTQPTSNQLKVVALEKNGIIMNEYVISVN